MGRFVENSSIFWFISGVASDFRRFRSRGVAKIANSRFSPRGVTKSGKLRDVPSETPTFLTLLAQRGNAIFKKVALKPEWESYFCLRS